MAPTTVSKTKHARIKKYIRVVNPNIRMFLFCLLTDPSKSENPSSILFIGSAEFSKGQQLVLSNVPLGALGHVGDVSATVDGGHGRASNVHAAFFSSTASSLRPLMNRAYSCEDLIHIRKNIAAAAAMTIWKGTGIKAQKIPTAIAPDIERRFRCQRFGLCNSSPKIFKCLCSLSLEGSGDIFLMKRFGIKL